MKRSFNIRFYNMLQLCFLFKKCHKKDDISTRNLRMTQVDSAEHSGNDVYPETSLLVGESAAGKTGSCITLHLLFTLQWTSNHRRSTRSTAGTLNINALSPLTTGGTPGNLIRRKKRRDVGDKDVREILECEAGAVKRSHVSLLVIYFSKETIGR